MLTFRASLDRPESEATADEGEGIITIITQDGDSVELGRYDLDGKLHTRWYTIPGSVLRQGVPPVPTSRLVYHIQFSTPVELHASWVKSDQWLFRWDSEAARFWDSVDPGAFLVQEGRTVPGVRFDADTNSVHWAGMDDSQSLLIGVETDSGLTRVYMLPPELTGGNGQGSFTLSDLPANTTVTSVFAQPAHLPIHTVFGAEGDTAAPWRNPGIALLPEASWTFEGKPVGVARRLVGQGRIQISVPATGRPYLLLITLAGVAGKVQWSLQAPTTSTDGSGADASRSDASGADISAAVAAGPVASGAASLASGSLNAGDSEFSILLPGAGIYELVMKGGSVRLQEAWLLPADQSE